MDLNFLPPVVYGHTDGIADHEQHGAGEQGCNNQHAALKYLDNLVQPLRPLPVKLAQVHFRKRIKFRQQCTVTGKRGGHGLRAYDQHERQRVPAEGIQGVGKP